MYWLKIILSNSCVLPAAASSSFAAQLAKSHQTNTHAAPADFLDRERMAEVIVGLKVLPKTVDVDLDKLEEKIRKLVDPEKMEREPIAFGLVAVHIVKLVPDAGGQVDELEKKLKSIDEVGEVEVTGITRSL